MWTDFKKVRVRKICFINCKKYKELKRRRKWFAIKHYFFLVFVTSVEVKMKKIFKEEESTELAKNFLVWLKIYNYFKNMSQEFRLKNIDEEEIISLKK